MELNKTQFTNDHDPTGSTYSPGHSRWSMSGGGGAHAKPGRKGRADDSGYRTPERTRNDPTSVGRHTTTSEKRARLGMKYRASRFAAGSR